MIPDLLAQPAFQAFFAGPYGPYLPAVIFLILLGVALWDARTGIIPDTPMAVGAVAVIVARFVAQGWKNALEYFLYGAAAAFIIWAFNELWYRLAKKDALGMGDAKWTALAVATFGVMPGVFAWFAGAWVALAWIGLSWAAGRRIRKVYYAPFLFCGLTLGILVARRLIELPFGMFG